MSVHDLEHAISELSPEELAQLGRWFDEYRADEWDRQIEADVRAGELGKAVRRADADFEAGRCTPYEAFRDARVLGFLSSAASRRPASGREVLRLLEADPQPPSWRLKKIGEM